MKQERSASLRTTRIFSYRVLSPLAAAMAACLFVGGTAARADTIYQTVNDTSDSSPNWDDAVWGSPAAAPTAGNDYISDGNVNSITQLRTGSSGGTSDFAGDSLTLRNGATLITKKNFQANIILEDGGTISAGDSDDPTGGSITVNTGQSGTYNVGGRTIDVGASVNGGGTLFVTGSTSGHMDVNSTSNTFSGLWDVSGGAPLTGVGDGSLGTASFNIHDGSTLAIDYAFAGGSTSDLTLGSGGLFDLNTGFNSTFQNVTVGGDVLAAGTYTYGDLTASQQAYFVSGGDSFTVAAVPEPASGALALLGLGGALLTVRRRRYA